ncbi:MAG: DUF5035 family protein [Bacteroidaceae bacterium]
MKAYTVAGLLVSLVMSACGEALEGDPSITVDSVWVNSRQWDMASRDTLPFEADVRVFASLATSSGTLTSFAAEVACQDDDTGEQHPGGVSYESDDVSTSGMTNADEGVLRFKDGVVQTHVVVGTVASHPDSRLLRFSLFLNAGDRGIKQELEFRLKDR